MDGDVDLCGSLVHQQVRAGRRAAEELDASAGGLRPLGQGHDRSDKRRLDGVGSRQMSVASEGDDPHRLEDSGAAQGRASAEGAAQQRKSTSAEIGETLSVHLRAELPQRVMRSPGMVALRPYPLNRHGGRFRRRPSDDVVSDAGY
ncbi:MAG: hypothetical protein AB1938_08270 [Myxococcota bacterium]